MPAPPAQYERYHAEFTNCLDATIATGVLLAEDQAELLAVQTATAGAAFATSPSGTSHRTSIDRARSQPMRR